MTSPVPTLTAPPRRLVALDVETADEKHQQICSIALVMIEDDRITGEWSSLVCPPSPPNPRSVDVHGLTWQMLHDQPPFAQVWPIALGLIADANADAVVAHFAKFDRSALEGNCAAVGLAPLALPWICTVDLGRIAWPKPSVVADHRLPTLAAHLGIELKHHDALSDARACAKIYLAACKKLGAIQAALSDRPTPALPPAPTVAGEERMGTDGAHRWTWTIRDGYASLALNDRLLLEVLSQQGALFEARVFQHDKMVACRIELRGAATARQDELLLEALRAAVLVARQNWRLQLSPEAWKKIVEGRPRVVRRAA